MKPLILRPQPAADELANFLRQEGHRPVVCPLLEYRPGQDLPLLAERLTQADIIIATSQAAVTFSTTYLKQHQQNWPADATYFAIGQTTAQTWLSDGIEAIYPEDARSEGLLAHEQLQTLAGKQVLILRGNGGRDLLADTLSARSAHVHYLECYQRHYPDMPGLSLWEDWQAAGIDSVIITSSEIFRQLLSLLPTQATTWLSTLRWFVPTQRIADVIQAVGFQSILIMTGAHHQAVVTAFRNAEDKTDE